MNIVTERNELLIQPLQAEQLADIQQLEQNSSEQPWTSQQIADCFEHNYIIQTFIRHSERQELIGYWIWQRIIDEIHLHNFTISRVFQGMGFGKACLTGLVETCRRQNTLDKLDVEKRETTTCPIRSIELEVRYSNVIAQKLYQACGFKVIGQRKAYYRNHDGGSEDALLMKCVISS